MNNFVGELDKALSEQEAKEFIQKINSGDKEVENIFIQKNIRLVIYIVNKLNIGYVPDEDLTSYGIIGLIKAVRTFDSEVNIKFVTYAYRCIRNEIFQELRHCNRELREDLILDQQLTINNNKESICLIDTIKSDEKDIQLFVENDIQTKALYKALEFLTERDRDIIILGYGLYDNDPKTQLELSKIFNITQSHLSRLLSYIIPNKLRKIINEMEMQNINGICTLCRNKK